MLRAVSGGTDYSVAAIVNRACTAQSRKQTLRGTDWEKEKHTSSAHSAPPSRWPSSARPGSCWGSSTRGAAGTWRSVASVDVHQEAVPQVRDYQTQPRPTSTTRYRSRRMRPRSCRRGGGRGNRFDLPSPIPGSALPEAGLRKEAGPETHLVARHRDDPEPLE